MDGTEEHHVNQNKTDSERQICVFSHMQNLDEKGKDMKAEEGLLGMSRGWGKVGEGIRDGIRMHEYSQSTLCSL
jgi:hypothetical protein